MAVYMTKQRTILLNFLSCHPHEIFSAFQIAEKFSDEKISLSAVYRNLSELETAGKIQKVSKSGSREVFYRYIHATDCENRIHLVCKICEKSFHMDSIISDKLALSILETHLFNIDKTNTVITGICNDCIHRKN